jgi:predicted PurR-regulated permease PerM
VVQRIPVEFRFDPVEAVKNASGRAASFIAAQAGGLLRDIVVFIFNLVVMLFALFFFFRDGRALMTRVRRALPFEPVRSEKMLLEARDLIHASLVAGLIVAAAQGAAGGLMFAVLGVGAPLFWGVVMAFFSLLPMVGAWVVWGPAAIILIASGSVTRGVIMIALGVGIVGMIDNVLRPALLSGRTQLNGLLVFISLLGGISAFGLIGIVLGPIVVATTLSLLDAYGVPAPGPEAAGPAAAPVEPASAPPTAASDPA